MSAYSVTSPHVPVCNKPSRQVGVEPVRPHRGHIFRRGCKGKTLPQLFFFVVTVSVLRGSACGAIDDSSRIDVPAAATFLTTPPSLYQSE